MQRLIPLLLAIVAGVAGYALRGWLAPLSGVAEEAEHADEHAGGEEEPPHVPLTREAFETLRIELAPVKSAPFTKVSSQPAEVVEYPGVSAHKLAAPVAGVVTAIATQPGAAVAPDEAIFELRIADERVLDAQLKLLESLTRLEIVDDEQRRLEPLAESGAVRGRQRLDLEYERRQLTTTIDLRRGELEARGLTASQVDQLMRSKQLLKSVVVRAPRRIASIDGSQAESSPPAVVPVAWEALAEHEDYTAERLLVEPGQTVDRGDPLCDLATHGRLYLRGLAYEADLPRLVELARAGAPLAAEFGHSLQSHHATSPLVEELRVRYVANHVDPQTQSYEFYLPLANQVLSETTDEAGRRFRTWRFSVGQRAHVLLPTEQIDGGIPVPLDAVAIDGPNAMVFRPMSHEGHVLTKPETPEEFEASLDHDHHDDHDEAFVELEAVPVQLLYRDSRTAVVAAGGELAEGNTIAMNSAYQLFLALQAMAEGGGHHHDHDH